MDSRKNKIVIAIMVAMFLGAVEGTIVTTAIPTIVKELNGFHLISWVFSLYLLTSAISTPIYGKLSDLYGRKNILSIGIVIFLVGSALCGLSQNMVQLIGFRALQGLGAGAIFTVTYTIVGDVFSLEERAKVQGWLGSVWGIASLAGPFLGGFLIDHLSWHWIFFINIPFGILSLILLKTNLIESYEKKKHKIDYAGALLLSAAIVLLLYGAVAGAKSANVISFATFIPILFAITLLVAFYHIEKRVEEPMIPFEIFTQSNTVVSIISFLVSAVLIGISVYMPIYMQNVLGFSPTIAGLSMAPMSISWVFASVVLGKAIPKYGQKVVIGVSTFIMLLSCLLLPTLGVQSPIVLAILFIFIIGFGFGGGFTTLTIIVQSSVDYKKRGIATAVNSLVRTLGQTIGVSFWGSIFNYSIVQYFNNLGIPGIQPNNLYATSGTKNGLSVQAIRDSLNAGLHSIFLAFILIAIVCTLFSLKLSNELKESSRL